MNLKKNACLLPSRNRQLFKNILFFILLCSVMTVQGQIISITANDATGAETVNPPTNVVQFTVRKGSFPIDVPDITVNYSISGSASNGDDYDELDGTVEVSGDASAQTTVINVPIKDDQLVEGTESITLTLESGPYAISGSQSEATATILDNDIGTFSLEVTEPNAAEENQVRGRFIISLDKENATGGTISVPYTLSPTATNGADASDYNVTVGGGQPAGTLTFPPGQSARALNIIPVDDSIPESDETVVLTLGPLSSTLFVLDTAASSGSVVITDNDCSAGEDEPKLNNNSTDFCDVTGVDLNDFYDDDKVPTGAQLRWSLVEDPAVAAQLLTTAAASNAPANTYYAIFWSAAEACASPSDGPLTITINQSPDAGTADTGLFSCNDDDNGPTNFDLDDALTGADPGGDWSNESGPGGNITVPASGIIDFNGRGSGNYVFRYTVTGSGACADDFVEVTISVSDCDPCIAGNVAPAIDPATPRVFCGAITVNLNDYTNSTPPTGTVLRWSLTEPTDTVVPAAVSPANPGRGTYYGYFYDSVNDCASPALQVIITLNTAPMITNSTAGTRCGPGPVTFSATANSNATFNWYTAEVGGALLFTGANVVRQLTQTTTYYLVATENGCPSPRVPVTGTVQLQPTTGTVATGVSSCNNSSFGTTTIDLDTLLTDEDPGDWVFTSGPADVPINGDNIVDFSTRPDGDYVYTYTTSGAQAPCTNESVAVSISVSSCDTDADGDGLLGGLEATLGTDPNDVDSDNDLINDNVEVGPDTANPLDEDGDGIIDALDSNLADSDSDGVVDQLDPANNNACIPDSSNALCDEPIDLEVLKVIDNPNAVVGEEVTFTITVNNLGPRTAETLVIGDFLESGFEYKSNIPSRGAYDENTGQWQLANLASGTGATLSITVEIVPDVNEMYMNTAELLSSDPLDSNPENDSSTVNLGVEQPEGVTLAIEKTARLGPNTQRLQALTGLINDVENTLTVEYFIKVTNESAAGGVTNIGVRDIFETDADITFEIMEEANVPDGSSFNTATGIWNISRSLEAGEEIELAYTVVFEGIGIITNTAEIVSPVNSNSESIDISSMVTLEITTRNELEIGILYNQFSPNADGINDFLKVNNLRKNELGFDELVGINYSIDIYNRYGSLVYEASGLTEVEAWDGTWKGKDVPEGTYFYGLNVTIAIEGEPETQKTSKGWIQLIR